MTIEKSAWLLFFIACLIRSSTSSTCVRIDGAPVANIHINTCENIPQLLYLFTENYMLVSASLESCPNADEAGETTSSVYFNEPRYIDTLHEYTLEYTIMATDVDSHCVVNVIGGVSLNLTDQNGLSNEPLEDISQFALHQWYTRKFRLMIDDNDANSRVVRIGLTCAARTPLENGFSPQSVLIRGIRLVTSGNTADVVIYNYQLCASGCEYRSIPGSLCMPASDGSAMWTYPSDVVNKTIKTGVPLAVQGDVQTTDLWVASSLYIDGCLKSVVGSEGVRVHLPPGRNVTIHYRVGCMLPRLVFIIDVFPAYSAVNISTPYSPSCLHRYYPENVVVTLQSDHTTFFAGSDTVYEECHNDTNAESDYMYRVAMILAIVFSIAGAVGIFLGIFFGVRKCRQQQQKRSLSAVEVPMA